MVQKKAQIDSADARKSAEKLGSSGAMEEEEGEGAGTRDRRGEGRRGKGKSGRDGGFIIDGGR